MLSYNDINDNNNDNYYYDVQGVSKKLTYLLVNYQFNKIEWSL